MGAEVYCPPSVGVVNQYSNPHWILTLGDYSRSFRHLLGELTFNSQKKLSRFAVNTPKVILQCKATRDFEKRHLLTIATSNIVNRTMLSKMLQPKPWNFRCLGAKNTISKSLKMTLKTWINLIHLHSAGFSVMRLYFNFNEVICNLLSSYIQGYVTSLSSVYRTTFEGLLGGGAVISSFTMAMMSSILHKQTIIIQNPQNCWIHHTLQSASTPTR